MEEPTFLISKIGLVMSLASQCTMVGSLGHTKFFLCHHQWMMNFINPQMTPAFCKIYGEGGCIRDRDSNMGLDGGATSVNWVTGMLLGW
tara:strand:- start:306 stop:572 length:267 start_codon:yes stop_codon:yes gene_type:complete